MTAVGTVIGDPAADAAALSAAESAATKATAQDLAAIITAGMRDPAADAAAAEAKAAADAAAAAAAAGAVIEDTVVEEPTPIAELEQVLQDAGLDLGVDPATLPAEMVPVYERLAARAADLAQVMSAERTQSAEALRQVQEFAERLEKEPGKVLLALAISRPDIFAQAVEKFQLMQSDPRELDIAKRELQSEARLREAERHEALFQEQDRVTQARRVIAATQRAARKHGIDFKVAEQVVAVTVRANGGTLEVNEVDGIVAGLRPVARPTVRRLVSPAAAAAAAAAPQRPIIPSPAPVGSPGLTDVGGDRKGGGGGFRNLIRAANDRLNAALSGQ